MLRRSFVSIVVLLLTLFAVGGSYRFEGPVVITLTPDHGVHAADLVLMLLAALALTAVWWPAARVPSR